MRQRSSYPKPFKAQVVQEMPATGRNPIQRRHQPRHQRQRDPQVATALPRSATSDVAGFRSVESYAQTAGGRVGDY